MATGPLTWSVPRAPSCRGTRAAYRSPRPPLWPRLRATPSWPSWRGPIPTMASIVTRATAPPSISPPSRAMASHPTIAARSDPFSWPSAWYNALLTWPRPATRVPIAGGISDLDDAATVRLGNAHGAPRARAAPLILGLFRRELGISHSARRHADPDGPGATRQGVGVREHRHHRIGVRRRRRLCHRLLLVRIPGPANSGVLWLCRPVRRDGRSLSALGGVDPDCQGLDALSL